MSAPERIYLHGWDPDYPHDASWCADKVDDDDVVYVRLRSAPGETPTGNGIGGYVVAEDEGVYAFFDPDECPDGSVPPEAVPALLVKGRNAMLSAGGSPTPAPGETEALREALEEIATHAEAGMKGSRPTYDLFRRIARRALAQHVGGEG